MGMKENFTLDEWENLISLPYAVSLTVMVAAPSVLGVWGETKAVLQEPAHLATLSGSGLVGLLFAEMQSRVKDLMKDQQNAWKHDQTGTGKRLLTPAGLRQLLWQKFRRKRVWLIKNGSWPSV